MELYNSSMTFYNYMIFWVKFFTKIYIFFVENWQTITNFLFAQNLPGVPAPCSHAIRQLPPPPIDPQKMFPANIATTAANQQTFTRDIFLKKVFSSRMLRSKKYYPSLSRNALLETLPPSSNGLLFHRQSLSH